MSDFLKSSDALDKAVNESTNFEEMRERMLQTLAAQGRIVRSRTDAYDVRVVGGQPSPEPEIAMPVSPARDTCARVIYPAGNNRFELYGASEAELDEKERQIRAMFGG